MFLIDSEVFVRHFKALTDSMLVFVVFNSYKHSYGREEAKILSITCGNFFRDFTIFLDIFHLNLLILYRLTYDLFEVQSFRILNDRFNLNKNYLHILTSLPLLEDILEILNAID